MELIIGISTRVTHAINYNEERDSIARDWSTFMLKNFSDAKFIFLPNIEDDIEEYIQKWNVNCFFLTGGEDFGTSTSRDITEINILKYAIKHDMPIIGICRGFQLLASNLGATIIKQNEKTIHLSNNHIVVNNNQEYLVNSFHSNIVSFKEVPNKFETIAICKIDNSLEAFKYENMLGLMWHPERTLNILGRKFTLNSIKNHIYESDYFSSR